VPVQLLELATELPVAVSFAMAGGITAFREGRRRASLNEAMHELRRPLQVLALSLSGDPKSTEALHSSLQVTAAAVDRLDREINGKSVPATAGPTAARPVVEAALARWQTRASLTADSLTLRWSAGEVVVAGGEVELNQAVDNLISNGLVHGGGQVSIEGRRNGDLFCLVVRNSAPLERRSRRRHGEVWARLSGRSRHGHGLRVVRRVAADCGGSFRLRRSGGRYEARLQLPLAEGGR
jgi:signal transduction histidine kinase